MGKPSAVKGLNYKAMHGVRFQIYLLITHDYLQFSFSWYQEHLLRAFCYSETRENEGAEREAAGPALEICHVHESYF